MSILKRKDSEQSVSPTSRNVLERQESDLPLIVSARNGLVGKDDAIVRRVPAEYANQTVKQVLEYVMSQATNEEIGLAESVRKELAAKESFVMINGKKAEVEENASKYATTKEHEVPGVGKKQYLELEVEVSSIQTGGLYNYLR